MWLLILFVAVSVLVTVIARRRTREPGDSVNAQRRQLEALRIAAMAPPAEPTSPPTVPAPTRRQGAPELLVPISEPRRDRRISTRGLLIGGGAVIVVVVAGLAVGFGLSSSGGDSTGPVARARSHPTSTTTAPTTTTTVAPVAAITGTTRGTVTISVPVTPYLVSVVARAACWMQAEQADKTVVVTTTLQTGDSKQVTGTGALTVRLGNPAGVDVSVNGQPMALPASGGSTMVLQLNPTT